MFSLASASASQIARADPSVDALGASSLLKEWFLSAPDAAATNGDGERLDWEDDKSVLAWMENKVRQNTALFRNFCPSHRATRSIKRTRGCTHVEFYRALVLTDQ